MERSGAQLDSSPRDCKIVHALSGETQTVPPIWLMRQAGRYLPEYREVRAGAGSFLDLCYNSDLASEVTLQPIRRYDFDAAILFADILLIPHALGRDLAFVENEGPKLTPIESAADVVAMERQAEAAHEALSPVMKTVEKVRVGLADDKALIGFAGAPWTVATYLIEGGSVKDPSAARRFFYADAEAGRALINLLVDVTADYLIAQIHAGCDVVQIFDSWASGLPDTLLTELCLKPAIEIADRVKAAEPRAKVIAFPRGAGVRLSDWAQAPSIDGVGLDTSVLLNWARAHVQSHAAVQGNLDPLVLEAGGAEMLKAADEILDTLGQGPLIFNLGHGIVPTAPPEHVAELVRHIRSR